MAADAVQSEDPRSLSLRTPLTSGWSRPRRTFNNVMRTTIEAMAATQGHTQCCTNALDEALALPTDFSPGSRNTQLFLQRENGTNRIIDPWGGSYYVERLTRDLAAKAWGISRKSRPSAARPRPSKPVPKLRTRRPQRNAGADRRRTSSRDRRQCSSLSMKPRSTCSR
jgi:methylmalonyl-CoA mutase